MALYLFLLFCLFLFVYSFFWVDPNLTLINLSAATIFFDRLRHFGFFQREIASAGYLVIVLILFTIQCYFLFSSFLEKADPKKLFGFILLITFLATFSYPFLSHDVFNYLFVSKIILFYRQNPYLKAPWDFSGDPWLRFMHWTHATTPYGPVWVVYSILPGLFSFGKFTLNLFWWKLFDGLMFLATGWLFFKLFKGNRMVFVFWFFNPFLLIELLVNAHNELLMIFLAVLGVYLYKKERRVLGILTLVASVLTKYISLLLLPFVLLRGKRFRRIWLLVSSSFLVLFFVLRFFQFQPWYFTWIFIFLPFLSLDKRVWGVVLFIQLLVLISKYYPFLRFGRWDSFVLDSFLPFFFVLFGLFLFMLELRRWKRG